MPEYKAHSQSKKDPNCIFCKIVEGSVPSYHVYKDHKFEAFLDVTPLNPGHVLVVPKDHHRWVWDVPDVGEYFEVARKVVKAMQKALGTEWVVAAVIGQMVPHAHIQLIPRFKDDGHGEFINWTARKRLTEEQMEQAAGMIRKALE